MKRMRFNTRIFFVTLLVLAGLTLITLPYGIGYGIKYALQKQGAEQAQIENVDFNPFTGLLVIHNLSTGTSASALRVLQATLHVDWWPLWRRQIVIQRIELNGTTIAIRREADGAGFILEGLANPLGASQTPEQETPASEKPWSMQLIAGRINNSNLHYSDPVSDLDIALAIDDLGLGLDSITPERQTPLQLSGQINNAPININMELQPFLDSPGFNAQLILTKFPLHIFSGLLPKNLQKLAGQLDIDTRISLTPGAEGSFVVHQEGAILISNLEISMEGMEYASDTLAWDGNLSLNTGTSSDALDLQLSGKLDETGLHLEMSDTGLTLSSQQVTWSGDLKGDIQDPATLYSRSSLSVNSLSVQHKERNLEALAFDQLDLDGLILEGTSQISSSALTLSKLTIARPTLITAQEDKPQLPLLALQRLEISPANLTDLQRLETDHITLHNLHTRIQRNPDQRWHLIEELLALVPAASEEADSTGGNTDKKETDTEETVAEIASASIQEPSAGREPSANQKPSADQEPPASQEIPVAENLPVTPAFSFRIGTIEVLGESQLDFIDEAVSPVFNRNIKFKQIRLSNIDSSQPLQPTQLVLHATEGEYAQISLEGEVQPFTPAINLDLKGKLSQIDLPSLSSYTAITLGYNLHSGTLDNDMHIVITDGILDGQNILALNQLKLQAADPEKVDKLTTRLSMPLDAALSTLRDKHDNINLNLPVTGPLSDPSFDLSDTINQAVANALKASAIGYLKHTLQPYGALITIIQFARDKAAEVHLEPVRFNAGSGELEIQSLDYISKITELMRERPALNLKLCGIAVPADREILYAQRVAAQDAKNTKEKIKIDNGKETATEKAAITIPPVSDDELHQLASLRANNIKAYLVTEQQIPSERLFLCNPEVTSDSSAEPRVTLGL